MLQQPGMCALQPPRMLLVEKNSLRRCLREGGGSFIGALLSTSFATPVLFAATSTSNTPCDIFDIYIKNTKNNLIPLYQACQFNLFEPCFFLMFDAENFRP